MFEKALIRTADGRDIDIGLVAETIFFYGHTHLLINRSVLQQLTKMPLGDLLALSSRGCLSFSYYKPMFAVSSSGPLLLHDLISFEVGTKDKLPKNTSYQDEILDVFIQSYGNSAETKRSTKKFIDKVRPFKKHNSDSPSNIIKQSTIIDFNDVNFTRAAAQAVLKNIAPYYAIPSDFRFKVIDTGRGFVVDSNIDLKAISNASGDLFEKNFNFAHILSFINEARADNFFAMNYMAEIITTEVRSNISRLKHYDFIQRSDLSRKEIIAFTEIASDRCPSIREAIMSKDRTISDFLRLLDQAEKFKDWLQSGNPDQGLLNAYMLEATNKSWAEKIPGKSIRIAALTGLGLATEAIAPTGLAIGAAIAMSAADAMLLERLAQGWKPTHFITGPYRKFVDASHR
jgi:hypothetical protein